MGLGMQSIFIENEGGSEKKYRESTPAGGAAVDLKCWRFSGLEGGGDRGGERAAPSKKMDATMAEPGEILPERKPEKSPYEVLRQSKASVEEIVSKMLSVKKEGKPKSELRELATQIFLNFVALRQVTFAFRISHCFCIRFFECL